MNPVFRSRRECGVTLFEVAVVIAVLALLAVLVAPSLYSCRSSASRISCVNNLKNIGLGFRIFSAANAGKWPWQLSGTNGTRDFLDDPNSAWRHFAWISNELSTPKILHCPLDSEHPMASGFSNFGPGNLSYFLGLQAEETNPQSILAGDRNLTTNDVVVGPGLLMLGNNLNVGFSKRQHKREGNVLLGDGSVQQVTSGRLQESVGYAVLSSTNALPRLLIP